MDTIHLVEVKVIDESEEEDIIEVFNGNGSVEWETEYEYISESVLVTNELLSFPSSTKLLLQDSIATADTGSTTNLSGSKRGATNLIQTTYGSIKQFTHDASGRDLHVIMIYDLNCTLMFVYEKISTMLCVSNG